MRNIVEVIDRMLAKVDDAPMRAALEAAKSSAEYSAPEGMPRAWRKLQERFGDAFDPDNEKHHAAGRILAAME